MRVPLSWLAEYVDVPESATPTDVAADLVRVGLEEEGLIASDITGPLVVGRVLTREPEKQKNGKTINWCSLDVGRGESDPQWIVCGAHNFDVGDDVVVAMPGAVLPGGFAITPRKTYGHVSDGMICSTSELGLGEDTTGGIIVLREAGHEDVSPGDDALKLLGLVGRDSEGVEINVTPDRGYCFSIRGVAREYAHARREKVADVFRDPAAIEVPRATDAGFRVALDEVDPQFDMQGCARFVAHVVRGVDPSAASPAWLQRRLTIAGMRPISAIVDITNYVMLALGQPLHAYDLAALDAEHGITVRRARAGERITTLDGADRALHPQDLLITDGPEGARPIGIAGVMGGADTEVSSSTTDVLVESAWFDPITVARSARRHKLPSEASKRFERGVDTQLQAVAAQMASQMIAEICGGKVDRDVTDEGHVVPGLSFDVDIHDASRLVGVVYEGERVVEILTEIGCAVSERGETLTVTPPSWRPDLATAPDLAEEIARIDGYEKIPSILPVAPVGTGLTHGQRVRRRVSDTLAAQGLHEVLTYPFTSVARFDALRFGDDDVRRHAIALANPLSSEEPLMRPQLLCTLVDAWRRNDERGAENLALFEVGMVTTPQVELPKAPILTVDERPSDADLEALNAAIPAQPVHAAGIMSGERARSGWQGDGEPATWADAIAVARQVAGQLGVVVRAEADDVAPWHPGRCARLVIGDATFGHAGELHPKVCETLRLPERTVAFEVDVDVLIAASEQRRAVSPISTHQVVKEDVALIVPDSVPVSAVADALSEGGGHMLESVRLFDVYTGEKIGEGKRSLAFALRMRASNRTLNAEESARIRGAAVGLAAERHGAVLREG